MATGSKIRVIDNNGLDVNDNFLYSTAYYDEHGRLIQTLGNNFGGGNDYDVSQYDFSGKVISTFSYHKKGSGPDHTITSKMEYDHVGRIKTLSKNFNNSFYKQLASYSYDEMGQLKTKKLAPGYNGSQIEELTYDYNIQGWLVGINKAYALGDNDYTQWDRHFGVYLGYENGDARFASSQYNGTITGTIWRSQGDNAVRKFDYVYDRLNRLTAANFAQRKKPSEATWSNSQTDFSTAVTYADGNGNIASLSRMGIIPGQNNGVLIDDIRYTYKPTGISGLTGNRLLKAEDLGGLSSTNNGLLGDFKDISNEEDYVYDENGNLVKDLNKGLNNGSGSGVEYNYMNKPSKITKEGESAIEFIYDAAGERLQKKVTYADNSSRRTTYLGSFIYEEFIPATGVSGGEELLFVLHEEGRLKIITPHEKYFDNDYELNAGPSGITTWPGGKQAVFEYFIKDHLGSTRMLLSEEYQKEYYKASMEASLASLEEPLFGQVDNNGDPTTDNELQKTRIPAANHSWPSNNTDVSRLTSTSSDKILGANLILKVMAGDLISSHVRYYFINNNAAGTSNPLLPNLTQSFINSLGGSGVASSISKAQSVPITNSLNANAFLDDFLDNRDGLGNPSAPRAYLNIIFLDEQFKFIEPDLVTPAIGTQAQRVQYADAGNANASMTLSQKAPQNGWAFVFISNESEEAVLFDDLQVTQEHGRIAEESHYYPFGMKIAGISSRAVNKLENRYGYQGDFAEHDEETGWDDFLLRSYDAQVGRWTGMDPYDEFGSGYVGMGNDPVNMIDANGGTVQSLGAFIGAAIGAATPYVLDLLDKNNSYKNKGYWAAAGAFVGAGLGYGISESLNPGTNGNPSRHFWSNTRAFYAGFFGSNGSDGLVISRQGFLAGDHAHARVPEIWSGLNVFDWINYLRPITVMTVLQRVQLIRLISNENAFQGYPEYNGQIQIPVSTGELFWRFRPSGPNGQYSVSVNGINELQGKIDRGVSLLNIVLRLILRGKNGGVMTDYEEHTRQLFQAQRAGYEVSQFIENWHRNIRDIVNFNNKIWIEIFERKVDQRKYRYLRAFGLLKLRFIRRKGWSK